MYLAFLPIILAIIIIIITLILSLFLIKRKNYIDIFEKSEYASLWLRLIAATIDIILILVLFKFIKFFLLPDGFFWEILIGPYYIWFYFAFFQSSNLQATLGMKMLRLKIVDENQEKIGFWRASVCLFSSSIFSVPSLWMIYSTIHQNIFLFEYIEKTGFYSPSLKEIIVSILTFIGIFIILLTKRNQGLHNFISRTLVIKNV